MIKTQATMLKVKLTRRYLDLVKDLYPEPTEDRVVGKLFNFVMTLPPTLVTPQSPVKKRQNLHQLLFQGIGISEKYSRHPRKR